MSKPIRSRKIVLPPLHPNIGLEVEYRQKLERMIDRMHRSILWWMTAAYRANTPEMALDDTKKPINAALAAAIASQGSPAKVMGLVMQILGVYWTKKFYGAAPKLANYFATEASKRVDGVLKQYLKDAGFMVDWKMTAAQNDVLRATIGEQVGLIKSIPEQYLTQVQGLVMRSVASGHDLKTLTDQLGPLVDLERIGLGRRLGEGNKSLLARTRRRAALIARDQNNKANAVLTKVRQRELGIDLAIWRHSHAGKTPRPTHVKMDGQTYRIDKGMYDAHEDRWVFPGELINCRCTSQSVLKGF